MAGDSYNPNMHAVPVPEADTTTSEDRPALDYSLPPPPAISSLQDQLIGESVTPGGNVFVRYVSEGGAQRDEAGPFA